MIPYVPEGPPPLDDDEDVGSPVDSPVGFPASALTGIHASVGIPFGDFAAAFPGVPGAQPSETSPSVSGDSAQPEAKVPEDQNNSNDVPEADFEDFQSADIKPSAGESDESPSGLHSDMPEAEVANLNNNDDFDDFQSGLTFPPAMEDGSSGPEAQADWSDNPTAIDGLPECDRQAAEVCETPAAEADEVVTTQADGNPREDEKTEDDADLSPAEQEQSDAPEDAEGYFSPFSHPTSNGQDHAVDDLSLPLPNPPRSDDEVEANDDDFGNFAEPQPLQNDIKETDAAEDDDFGDFSEPRKWSSENTKVVPETHEAEAADDDFGDFSQPQQWQNAGSETPAESGKAEGDEFANFGDFGSAFASSSNTCQENGGGAVSQESANSNVAEDEFEGFKAFANDQGDDDDFGDFGDFAKPEAATEDIADDFGAFSQPEKFPAFEAKEEDITQTLNGSAGGLLEQILEKMETVLSTCFAHSEEIPDEAVSLDSLNQPQKTEDEDGIWTFLVDFDKAFALRYQLTKSMGNDCFLKALNIDSRNVLKNTKKPTLPIFASQLGLLEPTRGSAEGGGKDNNNTLDSVVAPNDSEASIPAPEFDWNSSGLTNPLDKLEEQFLCKELTNTSTEVKLDPVQTILPQATRGASLPSDGMKNYSELSSTAQTYVDNLPDLSYMKARVLMFPVGHS